MTPARWRLVCGVFDAVVALAPGAREARLGELAGPDAELSGAVRALLDAHDAAGTDFLRTPAPVEALAAARGGRRGRRIGPYELGELIGHGGMGEVYGARRVDGQYAQEVAVKIVQAGVAAPLLIERFRQERQILASLEHDSIARLLDGGTTEEGVPYLVMERVRGQPIDAYCDAQRLSVTERLRLFERVCAAVAFAHRRLVVHRDLKPSNILVTDAGEPKLLDFGIAKILDAPHAAETTLLRPMTPEYASPEQLQGLTVTTATDVYSLGVVLYRLLTGRAPFATTRAATAGAEPAVRAGPAPPSAAALREAGGEGPGAAALAATREGTVQRLHRRLAGDLDHILLKALRPEPEQRYSSVEQFAEDLRRHLDGLPVLARRGGWRYRAGRFLARHGAAVGAAAALLATVVGGAAVAFHEARIAAENARRAEARFDDVRRLAHSLIFEVHDAVEPLPGSTAVRSLLVKRALEYLDGLSRESAGDVALRRELALAYEKVGAVQGGQSGNNLGDLDGALASFRSALAIRQALRAGVPVDAGLELALASDEGEIAGLLTTLGRLDEALSTYRAAVARLAGRAAPPPAVIAELQRLRTRYGAALLVAGDLKAAVAQLEAADQLSGARLREHPEDAQAAFDRAATLTQFADALRKSGRTEQALAALEGGVRVLAPVVAHDHPEWRRDLFVLKERVADALARLGRYAEEFTLRQEVLEVDLAAERADPANARARRDVYIDYFKLARNHFYSGRNGPAIVAQRTSLARIERELAATPGNASVSGDAAVGYYMLGEMLDQAQRPGEALAALQRSQAFTERIMVANPDDLKIRSEFAEGERKTGDLLLRFGERSDALRRYRRAVAEFEAVISREPSNVIDRSALATAYQHLGHYYLVVAPQVPPPQQRATWEQAGESLERSLAIWRDLRRRAQLAPEDAAEPAKAQADQALARAALVGLGAGRDP
ncbi:MAG: protein kinase [Proteobacteria bacterium]|nr:protein kinase [Pseudomonadota bacterium]